LSWYNTGDNNSLQIEEVNTEDEDADEHWAQSRPQGNLNPQKAARSSSGGRRRQQRQQQFEMDFSDQEEADM